MFSGAPNTPTQNQNHPNPNPAHTTNSNAVGVNALFPFLAITFGLTWGIAAVFLLFPDAVTAIFGEIRMSNPLFVLAVYAPAIAAFSLIFLHHGRTGVQKFVRRLTLWRCSPSWYLFLVLGIPALMLSGAAIKGTLFETEFPFAPWYNLFPVLALTLAIGPIEEFGWRGFALPLLQRRLAPIWASLVLGAVWGVWHLPAFAIGGTPQSAWSFGPYFIAILAVSLIMTAVFNAARGSILLPALCHFQLNNPLFPDAQPYDTILFVTAAAAIVLVNPKAMFQRDSAATNLLESSRANPTK